MADYARAQRLVELREATHLSRERVAGEIGVTTKSLYQWENGGKIRWENAKKLAAFYGVDAESLVSRDIGPAAEPPGDESQLDRIEQMLAEVLERLGDGAMEELVTAALRDDREASAGRAGAGSGGGSGGKQATPGKSRARGRRTA